MLFAICIILSSCSGAYLKPQVRCEAGKNTGNGNAKSDCWFYSEIGTVIKLEDVLDVQK